MRKILIPLLLAGVAAAGPAFADPSDQSQFRERHQQRAEREQRPERPANAQRQANVQRVEVQRSNAQDFQRSNFQRSNVQRVDVQRVAQTDPRVRQANQPNRNQRFQYNQQQRMNPVQQQQRVTFGQDRYDRRVNTQTVRDTDRRMPEYLRTREARVPRQGMQPPQPTRVRTTRTPQWSTNWRHDRRYDWRDYRSRNRARFHIGFYSDPFGWGYSPFSIGSRLWPNYYSSSYWINDPWQYRLPYAPPGTRWVRYWNDAILVDTWNGQVVDVIHNFFW